MIQVAIRGLLIKLPYGDLSNGFCIVICCIPVESVYQHGIQLRVLSFTGIERSVVSWAEAVWSYTVRGSDRGGVLEDPPFSPPPRHPAWRLTGGGDTRSGTDHINMWLAQVVSV